MKQKRFWNNEIVKSNLVWPNENVIRFVKRNIRSKEAAVLDFGCGAGRNSIALAKEGYNVIGMDYSSDAIKLAKEKATEEKIDVTFKVCDCYNILLPTNSVKAIIANGSLFYNTQIETVKLLNNLYDILEEDGVFWADWRTTKDSLYGMGVEIEPDFFEMNKESGREGCSYHFFDENTLRSIYEQAGFEVVAVDEFMYTENNRYKICLWFHVYAKNHYRGIK